MLHPNVASRVVPLFESGFHEEAVLNAFKAVEERLRAATGTQEVGTDLVKTAFAPGTGMLTDPEAWPAQREGLHQIVRGAFLAFRNGPGHRFTEPDEEEAFDLIVLANRLLLIAEEADRRRRAQGIERASLLPTIRPGELWGTAPAMLDADNDGENEVIVPTPGNASVPFAAGLMTHPERPIAIYDVTATGLVAVDIEPVDSGVGWTLRDIALVDVDGDGLGEVVCSLDSFGTIGSFLLLYKYRGGRYEAMRGTLAGTSADDDGGRTVRLFNNGLVTDFDGDGIPEIVTYPKRGFEPRGLLPDSQGMSGFAQARLIWKWDRDLAAFRLCRWDVEEESREDGSERAWRRLGP